MRACPAPHLVCALLISWPLATLGGLRLHQASAVAAGPARDPITDFCWGNISLLGQTIASERTVKGAIVLKRSSAGAWDWKQHQEEYGDLMAYHRAGIQPEEVQPFLQKKQPVIFLTAGVVGVLQLSEAAGAAIADAGYELLDLAEGNAAGEKIGEDAFHRHCRAGSLGLQNLSPIAHGALENIGTKVESGTPLVIRAYTADALILFNELHRQFPSMEFVGLIHSNC
uniref:Uncharacterized protein n=1 Tax=Alexandrium andersonii TaxID=327968 RepID=A0A7S2J310_9DINO